MSVPEFDAPPPPPPVLVGLVGGVGSGKSTVARMLAGHGATVLDADACAGRALEEPDVVIALAQRFGPDVVPKDGPVDRKAISARVFGPEGRDDRRFLEELIHPRVRSHLAGSLQEFQSLPHADRPFCVVLDVPLLLEGPLGSWCHQIVFIDSPEAGRRERTIGERGWNEGEFTRREEAQMDLKEKRTRADAVIPNHGTLQELDTAVKKLADTLREQASRKSDSHGDSGTPPHPSRGA